MTREEAIDILRSYLMFDKSSMQIDIALNMAIEALSADAVSREDTVTLNSPISIQAEMVAVVRCKDCRHRFYDKYNDCFMCDRHEYGESFEDDDFCSWGERREE